MSKINTRVFNVEELQFKPYGVLLNNLTHFMEIENELESHLEEIEAIEQEQGFLDSEMIADMNLITTQLDYLSLNIKNIIKAMKYHEGKVLFKMSGLPSMCVN